MQPPQDVLEPAATEAAYQELLQYGAIGAMLVIILSLAIALVWWTLRSTAKAIREKDEELRRVNDLRAGSVEKMVEALTTNNAKLAQILDLLENAVGAMSAVPGQIAVLNSRLKGPSPPGGISDDPENSG